MGFGELLVHTPAAPRGILNHSQHCTHPTTRELELHCLWGGDISIVGGEGVGKGRGLLGD